MIDSPRLVCAQAVASWRPSRPLAKRPSSADSPASSSSAIRSQAPLTRLRTIVRCSQLGWRKKSKSSLRKPAHGAKPRISRYSQNCDRRKPAMPFRRMRSSRAQRQTSAHRASKGSSTTPHRCACRASCGPSRSSTTFTSTVSKSHAGHQDRGVDPAPVPAGHERTVDLAEQREPEQQAPAGGQRAGRAALQE